MIELLEQCVRIPSLSGQERAVAEFLCAAMRERGFDHAFIDEAGNAVGVIGNGARQMVLLGHMDTVGGEVPVRYENGALYGRGTVDAKGALCAFVLAAAQVAPLVRQRDWTLIVIGAVEEETASSKGARFVAAQYQPHYCVIGEPSGVEGITLGYKGRLVVHARAEHPMRHTAVPLPNASEQLVALWNHVVALAQTWNRDKPKAFEQILPSLRRICSGSDGLREWCEMTFAARLPLGFGPEALRGAVEAWCGAQRDQTSLPVVHVRFEGAEQAWVAPKDSPLARAFVDAIRAEGMRPAFKYKTGTADFNVVGPVWRCPIVAYGPGDSALDHTPDEHVPIDEFEKAVKVLARALRALLV